MSTLSSILSWGFKSLPNYRAEHCFDWLNETICLYFINFIIISVITFTIFYLQTDSQIVQQIGAIVTFRFKNKVLCNNIIKRRGTN